MEVNRFLLLCYITHTLGAEKLAIPDHASIGDVEDTRENTDNDHLRSLLHEMRSGSDSPIIFYPQGHPNAKSLLPLQALPEDPVVSRTTSMRLTTLPKSRTTLSSRKLPSYSLTRLESLRKRLNLTVPSNLPEVQVQPNSGNIPLIASADSSENNDAAPKPIASTTIERTKATAFIESVPVVTPPLMPAASEEITKEMLPTLEPKEEPSARTHAVLELQEPSGTTQVALELQEPPATTHVALEPSITPITPPTFLQNTRASPRHPAGRSELFTWPPSWWPFNTLATNPTRASPSLPPKPDTEVAGATAESPSVQPMELQFVPLFQQSDSTLLPKSIPAPAPVSVSEPTSQITALPSISTTMPPIALEFVPIDVVDYSNPKPGPPPLELSQTTLKNQIHPALLSVVDQIVVPVQFVPVNPPMNERLPENPTISLSGKRRYRLLPIPEPQPIDLAEPEKLRLQELEQSPLQRQGRMYSQATQIPEVPSHFMPAVEYGQASPKVMLRSTADNEGVFEGRGAKIDKFRKLKNGAYVLPNGLVVPPGFKCPLG